MLCKVASKVLFYNPTSRVRGFRCSAPSSVVGMVRLLSLVMLVSTEPNLVVVGLHFLLTSDAEHLFICLFAVHISSLVKHLVDLLPIFTWIFFLELILRIIYVF